MYIYTYLYNSLSLHIYIYIHHLFTGVYYHVLFSDGTEIHTPLVSSPDFIPLRSMWIRFLVTGFLPGSSQNALWIAGLMHGDGPHKTHKLRTSIFWRKTWKLWRYDETPGGFDHGNVETCPCFAIFLLFHGGFQVDDFFGGFYWSFSRSARTEQRWGKKEAHPLNTSDLLLD